MINFLKKIKEKINFKKDLIKSFHNEHKKLILIYGEINSSINKKNFKKTEKLLKSFFENYKKHILKEDNYFYTYLRKKFKNENNLDMLKFIDKKQSEMENITETVKNFVKKHQNKQSIQSNLEEFQKEFKLIGKVLTERVNFEENKLYPLYKK